jgi:hypothetical protein
MSAGNLLFWQEVIEANQPLFGDFAPFFRRLAGGRIFFVLRCTHVAFAVISIRAKPW